MEICKYITIQFEIILFVRIWKITDLQVEYTVKINGKQWYNGIHYAFDHRLFGLDRILSTNDCLYSLFYLQST